MERRPLTIVGGLASRLDAGLSNPENPLRGWLVFFAAGWMCTNAAVGVAIIVFIGHVRADLRHDVGEVNRQLRNLRYDMQRQEPRARELGLLLDGESYIFLVEPPKGDG